MAGRLAGSKLKTLFIAVTVAATIVVLTALVATAGATEPDTTPPVVTISGTAVKAVEEGKSTGTYELHIAATDGSKTAPPSGVAKIEVGVDGSGQQSWEKYCPEGSCGLEENWTYSPASFSSEFPRWITVKVTDHAGNATEEEISIEGLEEVPREAAPAGSDTTPPTISFSGSAVEALETGSTTGRYELRMFAKDGSPSAPQSGIAKVEIGVDGTMLQSWEKYCPVGSCRLKQQWTYSPANYSGTGHVMTIVVHDHAGNVTTRTIGPDTTPPTIELSGPLTEGLKEGITSYPLHVHATDGSPEFPGSGVKKISISVDGEVVKTVEQACVSGSCPMNTEWTFESEKYPGEHEITVSATDQAGNESAEAIELSTSNGAIPACRPDGTSPEATPTEEHILEGGGQVSIYKLENGLTYEVTTPPSGFNPLSASEAELGKYNYPPRPGSGETQALEDWEAEVTGTTEGGSVACAGLASDGDLSGAFASGVRKGENWSGFADVAKKGEDKWKSVKGEFTQPEFPKENKCSDAQEYSWAGIGGYVSETELGLVQLGTVIKPKNSYVRLEVLEKNPTEEVAEEKRTGIKHKPRGSSFRYGQAKLKIEPTNLVYLSLRYVESKEKVLFNVVNETTHKKLSKADIAIANVGPGYFQGNSAEFVDERPSIGFKNAKNEWTSRYLDLPDFGKIGWSHVGVGPIGKSTFLPVSSFENQKIIMKGLESGAEQTMAAPGNLAPNGEAFTDNWDACHP